MNKWLVMMLAGAVSSQAALIQLSFAPSGTNLTGGLTASNEVPPAVTSTGSGGLLFPGGLQFETTNSTLYLAIGYGSAGGFSNLTGAATLMHLHGPAVVGSNAPVLVDLGPHNFPAANPALGGLIFGNVAFPTNSISNLLSGEIYLNIHTLLYPGGEIRGQLIISSNAPPVVICPPSTNIQCGLSAPLFAQVSSPGFGPLTVITSVNSTNFYTNSLAGSPLQLPYPPVAVPSDLPSGSNTVTFTAIDSRTNITTCFTTISILDTNPPTLTVGSPEPSSLWPPNHKMVSVTLRARVADACGPATWRVVSIRSNETGEDTSSSDWQITGAHTVLLRAEKKGNSTRTYTITVEATDQAGNVSAPQTVTIDVSH